VVLAGASHLVERAKRRQLAERVDAPILVELDDADVVVVGELGALWSSWTMRVRPFFRTYLVWGMSGTAGIAPCAAARGGDV